MTSSSILLGVLLSVVDPSPSWPKSFAPHSQRLPSALIAAECSLPSDTFCAGLPALAVLSATTRGSDTSTFARARAGKASATSRAASATSSQPLFNIFGFITLPPRSPTAATAARSALDHVPSCASRSHSHVSAAGPSFDTSALSHAALPPPSPFRRLRLRVTFNATLLLCKLMQGAFITRVSQFVTPADTVARQPRRASLSIQPASRVTEGVTMGGELDGKQGHSTRRVKHQRSNSRASRSRRRTRARRTPPCKVRLLGRALSRRRESPTMRDALRSTRSASRNSNPRWQRQPAARRRRLG